MEGNYGTAGTPVSCPASPQSVKWDRDCQTVAIRGGLCNFALVRWAVCEGTGSGGGSRLGSTEGRRVGFLQPATPSEPLRVDEHWISEVRGHIVDRFASTETLGTPREHSTRGKRGSRLRRHKPEPLPEIKLYVAPCEMQVPGPLLLL